MALANDDLQIIVSASDSEQALSFFPLSLRAHTRAVTAYLELEFGEKVDCSIHTTTALYVRNAYNFSTAVNGSEC